VAFGAVGWGYELMALRTESVGLQVAVAGAAAPGRLGRAEGGVVGPGVGDAAREGVAGGPEAVATGAEAKGSVGDELVAAESLEGRVVVAVGTGEGSCGGSRAGVADGVGGALDLVGSAFPGAAGGDAGARLGEPLCVEVGGGGHVWKIGGYAVVAPSLWTHF
jgi:hypothetical protein